FQGSMGPCWMCLTPRALVSFVPARSFVLVSPAVLYHPHPATLWLHLSDLQGPVQVRVQLQGDSRASPTILLRREVLEPDLHLNVTFPAPAPVGGEEEIVSLHVSIQGDSLDVSESKKVLLRVLSPGVFIQTDKAVYKPGQEGAPGHSQGLFAGSPGADPACPCQDPSGNHIAQWRELSPRQGIVDLSLPLASEPALGTYTISVEGKSHFFSVEEYVLPKFEVTIQLPSVLWEQDEKFPVQICGRYTYGQPVQGKVQAALCLRQSHPTLQRRRKSCTRVMGKTEKNGCFSTEVSMAAFKEILLGLTTELEVKASLIEDGTGLEIKSTKSCTVLSKTVRVTFENPDHVYKPGLPYSGTIQLQGADGSGLPRRQVLLSVTNQGKERTQSFLTDSSGRASFQLDTFDWSDEISLRAEVSRTDESQKESLGGSKPRGAFLTLVPYSSKSGSFLHIRAPAGELPCGSSQLLHVDSIFGKEALGTELKNLDLVFMVLAKGTITTIFRKEVCAEPGQRASFSLELPIGQELAPMAKLLVYVVLPNGEMVADVTKLYVAKCFPNQVKMAFSEARALPGAALRLQLGAAPGSLCAVRAVDRSVLLLKPEAELNAEAVSAGPAWGPPAAPGAAWAGAGMMLAQVSLTWSQCWVCSENEGFTCLYSQVYRALPEFKYPYSIQDEPLCDFHTWDSKVEIYELFQVKPQPARASLFLPIPELPVLLPGAGKATPDEDEDEEEPPAPRTYFPETWLWDLVPVGEGGSAEMTVTVPDAITEWEAGMFCTASRGLGLSPPVTLTAFQPFFVELALPYAVVRHETFTLKATVFNYLRQCLRVQVTLAESEELEVSLNAGDTYSSCVCADEAKTFQWDVRATSLGEVNITVNTEALSSTEPCGNELPLVPAQGRVDTVIKPLLVKPGGILVEKTHNALLCQEAAEQVSLEIPANILEGSQRAHITVTGDILGNALQNLDNLLGMPCGCGEQNMAHFAIIIYIQQYLEKTGQLQPDICAKIQDLLQRGYQQQLLFKHDDGSYSAFGKSDPTGNTWLTAFVLKSFGQARGYVAVDEQHITDALRWLQQRQKKSGCFQSVGKLFNNALQGGVSDELSLSAYVTAAMLEVGLSTQDPVVSSALKCLEASPTDDLYTQALLAYVFGLAGLQEQQQELLWHLAQHGISADGQLYWKRKGQAQKPLEQSWAAAAPAEVEMTAYVLLAYLTQPSVSPADLGTASQIVRWLLKQQNPYGGFGSTQDTVVALQALTKYAALTYRKNVNVTVTVTSPTGRVQHFVVDNSNRLLLQRAALPEVPGTYELRARGQGCVLVQVTLRYNVLPPPSKGAFELRVETEPVPSTKIPQFLLRLWARYIGERPTTNMAVIEAGLPSGYSPEKQSLVELKKQKLVKKVEVQPGQVIIYLDHLSKEEATFSFRAQRDYLVCKVQPAIVSLYDYYETGEPCRAVSPGPAASPAAPGAQWGL
ncbi:A2ML1 protein, partial [Prunella fulvescens]|nr:A2ML1 protein [Prunella fulvescens]